MKALEPKRPAEIDLFAAEVLDRLTDQPEASEIVLGGHFALKHFIDFRATHDIDAWWRTGFKQGTVDILREAVQSVASAHNLEFAEREFGDTLSLELGTGKKTVFSFQIAVRSIELEPPTPSPYPPIAIETLTDNIGGKMSALVNRGLARDFVDIKRVVDDDVATSAECWRLWACKNPNANAALARRQVLKHMTNLELRRPLETIADPEERKLAEQTRSYFKSAFVREPSSCLEDSESAR